MNKERYNQIIDSTYESYLSKAKNQTTEDLFGSMIKGDEIIHGMLEAHTRDFIPYTREQFIDKCKTDKEFSERWGLTIEDKELSTGERGELFRKTYPYNSVDDFAPNGMEVQSLSHQLNTRYDRAKIPTKLITLEYNNEKIEIYE